MRFKLTGQHYIKDQLLEAGTIISDDGEGDSLPLYTSPTSEMEGLDKEAQEVMKKYLAEKGTFSDNFPLLTEPQGADPGAMPVASPLTKGK